MVAIAKLSEIPEEGKDITLVLHKDDVELVNDRDDLVEIDSASTIMTVRFMDQQKYEHFRNNLEVSGFFEEVFKEQLPEQLDNLTGNARQHVFGMAVMIFKAVSTDRKPFLRQPETFLHPASQVNLCDALIKFGKRSLPSENEGV